MHAIRKPKYTSSYGGIKILKKNIDISLISLPVFQHIYYNKFIWKVINDTLW